MHSLVSQVKAETLNCLAFLCTVKWIGSPGSKNYLGNASYVHLLEQNSWTPHSQCQLCSQPEPACFAQYIEPSPMCSLESHKYFSFIFMCTYLWRNAYSCVYTYITVLSWFPDVVCQLSALEPSFPAKACSYAVIAKAVTPLRALMCCVLF